MLAGFVLSLVGVTAGAAQDELSSSIIWNLGAVYVPVVIALFIAVLTAISFYKIDRSKHEETMRDLAARKMAAP